MKYTRISAEILEIRPENEEDRLRIKEQYPETGFHKKPAVRFTEKALTHTWKPVPHWLAFHNFPKLPGA